MENYLWNDGIPAIEISDSDLYADDTVLVAETPGLLEALNSLYENCNEWKLKVNETKTKVLVFCKRYTDRVKLSVFFYCF